MQGKKCVYMCTYVCVHMVGIQGVVVGDCLSFWLLSTIFHILSLIKVVHFFFGKLSLPQTLLFLWDWFFCFFVFWLCYTACGMLVPRPGIEPRPWQWKRGVLTTGPPGKSLMGLLIMVTNIILAAELGHVTQASTMKSNHALDHGDCFKDEHLTPIGLPEPQLRFFS